jgi:CubicO group peptidase (beta-lactamase class C family)
MRAAGLLLAAVAIGLALGLRWLQVGASVGTGYAAKVGCSLHFNAGQDLGAVFRDYIALEVSPLGPALRMDADAEGVEASALDLVRARAVHRPGLGCTLLQGDASPPPVGEGALPARPRLDLALPWPLGDGGPGSAPPGAVDAALARAFAEPTPAERDAETAQGVPHAGERVRATKAIVVAKDGRLVAERYAPGYGPQTPMLSWSMGKSVTAALVGAAILEGRLTLDAPAPVPEWQEPGDPRRAITLDQLLRMSSGLAFEERFGPTDDLPRMLFTDPDTGGYAARQPLAAPPDTRWSYSSGTSNLVARILRDALGGDLASRTRWARERLFDPAGMTSAFLESDAAGTWIGSSFAFMTARDWARFGELHRLDGVWDGRRLLPEGWTRTVTTPTRAAPDGCYGAHWWLNRGTLRHPDCDVWPEVPADAFAARGHSGQYVVVVPSERLVVVRLGLSFPDDGRDGAARLVAELIEALRTP